MDISFFKENQLLIYFNSLFAILFSYYTFYIYKLRKKYQHIPGPPAKGFLGFYFGNLFELTKLKKDYKVGNDLILQW